MPDSRGYLWIIVTAVLAAFALDFALMVWLRRRRARGGENLPQNGGVYLFGGYSPILTGLRGVFSIISETKISLPNLAHGIPAYVTRSKTLRWLPDLAVIFFAVLGFCSLFLQFTPTSVLPGNEAIVFQTPDWALYSALTNYHAFPLWNPYMLNGLPFLADPMSHIFNPLVSLPILLWGVSDGFKIAVFLSFLAAALGMWRLGKILGLQRATCLWIALLFTFAGQPAARFFQGQYLFVFSFAWIPWATGFLIQIYRTRRYSAVVGAAVSLALMFFSGNLYYQFYMAGASVLFSLLFSLGLSRTRRFLNIDFGRLKLYLLAGILALGLAAVQIWPELETRDRLGKTTEVAGSQTPWQVVLDFTSKDTFRPDAYNVLPAREEYFAYIGWFPLLAALTAVLAWKKGGPRRLIAWLLLLIIISLLWISILRLPLGPQLMSLPLIGQFRHLLRVLIFTGFALIVLAGLGLDSILTWLFQATASQDTSRRVRLGSLLRRAVGVALLAVMLLTVVDVYDTNRAGLAPETILKASEPAAAWLRKSDPTLYTVRHNPNTTGYDTLLRNNLFYSQSWYHFFPLRTMSDSLSQAYFEAWPNYIIQSSNDPIPAEDARLWAAVDGYNIYRLEDSLPFAFHLPAKMLADPSRSSLTAGEVTAVPMRMITPNRYETLFDSRERGFLVMMMTHYPGWKVRVDGRPASLVNLSGYLGTPLMAGVHRYEFVYQPLSFYGGLAISLACLVGAIGYGIYRRKWTAASVKAEISARAEQALMWVAAAAAGVQAFGKKAWERAMAEGTAGAEAGEQVQGRQRLDAWVRSLFHKLGLAGTLFALSLGILAFTRFYALDRFPVYFFGDEAVQALYGEQLISQGFKDSSGHWLPIYVEAAPGRWTPLLPMYIHALTLTLFGKSIDVVRGTSAFVGLFAGISAALLLKYVFKAKRWWAAALFIGAIPAWLLHSRTAFETVMTTAFYACFLLAYLLYRTRSPRFIYLAVIFGAATFYTYSNAQLIIGICAIFLLLSDLPYHLSQKKHILGALGLLVVCALPLILFQIRQPGAMGQHLDTINSYWTQNLTLAEKLGIFFKKYFYALSPQYWFVPNGTDLPRHRWATVGHIHWLFAPFILIGILVCLRRITRPEYRAILLAGLATPVGAALADVGITRVLAFIVPAGILATIGMEWLVSPIKKRFFSRAASVLIFVALAAGNLLLIRQALVGSPTWFSDYGLYGLQYGAKQLFIETIPQILKDDPQANVIVTSSWANGADGFLRFFFTPQQQKRVTMGGVETLMTNQVAIDPHTIYVMTASEYTSAVESHKFKPFTPEYFIEYPDGTPGFYLARLEYVDGVSEVFEEEVAARKVLIPEEITLDGIPVTIRHSMVDMGVLPYSFDGDTSTLMRGMEANPFIMEFEFAAPYTISQIQLNFGDAAITTTAYVYTGLDEDPKTFQVSRQEGDDVMIETITLGEEMQVVKLRLEFFNYLLEGQAANIHIFDILLMP